MNTRQVKRHGGIEEDERMRSGRMEEPGGIEGHGSVSSLSSLCLLTLHNRPRVDMAVGRHHPAT